MGPAAGNVAADVRKCCLLNDVGFSLAVMNPRLFGRGSTCSKPRNYFKNRAPVVLASVKLEKEPATPARKGVHQFTMDLCVFKAMPAY